MTKTKKINALARLFYRMQGYNVEEGYRFDRAHHPQEKAMWHLANTSEQFWNIAGDTKSLTKEYKRGVQFIALNDDNGSSSAEDVDQVKSQVSVIALSEAFNKSAETIAKDVVRLRKKQSKVGPNA